MTGVVPIIPRFRFSDPVTRLPLAGGSLTVYLAGTTALAATYQDRALTVANTNPVVLDANGECLFWVDSARSYKLLLKDSTGATVTGWPVDNIPGVADIGAAAQAARDWAETIGADVPGAPANSRSAKSWAQESIAGTALGGSAKDWAQSASLPDGVSKSAKSYASDATAKALEASNYAAAAATGAKFFDTVALGNAGVADAATFGVKANGSDNFPRPRIYRRESAGVSTFLYEALPGAEFDGMKVLLSSATQQIGAPSPVTGSGPGNQVVLFNDPVVADGFLESVTMYVVTTGALKIARFTVSGSTATRVAEASVNLAATGLVTLTASDYGTFPVRAGENLALYGFPGQFSFIGATADGTGWRGGTYGATVALGATNTGFRIQANLNVATQTVKASALTPVNGGGTLSLDNVEKICLISNSYGAAAASIVGKSPVAIASALSEYNWANVSQGGASILSFLGFINNSTVIYGATLPQHKATYAVICENQNSITGMTEDTYYGYYQSMIDALRGFGTTPIIMSEWGIGSNNAYGAVTTTVDGEQRNVKGLRAVADANRIPFIDGTSKARTLLPFAYQDFWKSAHPGMRVMYVITDALRKTTSILPRPLRSMKIFRVRGTVTVATVADLMFRTIAERHRLFREIYIGQDALAETEKQNYDVASSITNAALLQTVNDEYYALKTGTATALGTYALIDCVLPSTAATGVKLSISAAGCTVYARSRTAGGNSWIQCAASADGLQFSVTDTRCVDGDRVAFLIFKAGGISLNASPVVTWATGNPRLRSQPEKIYPPRGTEMLTQPLTVVAGAVPAQWTNAGTLPAVVPVDGVTPTGTTGCVEVTSANGMSQPFAYASSDDSAEIVVRVWARRWVAKFDPLADFATAPVTYETCDTATLKVTLHGATGIARASAVMTDQVGLHWSEVEFRATLPALTTATTVDVRSGDNALQIAKVSVRAL